MAKLTMHAKFDKEMQLIADYILRAYRHAPNVGAHKSWVASDATNR